MRLERDADPSTTHPSSSGYVVSHSGGRPADRADLALTAAREAQVRCQATRGPARGQSLLHPHIRGTRASSGKRTTASRPQGAVPPGPRPASADLLLLSAVTLWGLSYSVVKFGLSEIAPLSFPVFRFGVGGIVLLVVLRWREGSVGVRREDLPLLGLVGLLGITLSQVGFIFALSNTSASDTALLGATAPIMTALLAALVGLERSGRRHWIAVLIGLAGVVLIVVGGASGAKVSSSLLGDGFALGNAFVSSASALPILPLLQRYSAHRILTYQMLIGTAILVPFAVPGLIGQDYSRVSLAGWGSLGYSVVFSGIVTNLLYFTAIGRVGPSRAAVYQYLQSFLAVLFAVVLLGEHTTLVQVLGGVVVVGGIVFGRSTVGRRRVVAAAMSEQPMPLVRVASGLPSGSSGTLGGAGHRGDDQGSGLTGTESVGEVPDGQERDDFTLPPGRPGGGHRQPGARGRQGSGGRSGG